MDENVEEAITVGLRLRGVDVVTAQEDNRRETPDPDILDRATALRRVVFTRDEDFLAEGTRRQREGVAFGGVIYVHKMTLSIGRCIQDLELIAKIGDLRDYEGKIEYLPL